MEIKLAETTRSAGAIERDIIRHARSGDLLGPYGNAVPESVIAEHRNLDGTNTPWCRTVEICEPF